MKSAMEGFSRDALGHAQRALQHAYALERLGASFTPAELQTAPRESQRMWAAMAAQHAAALESELGALRNQLQALGVPGLPISAQRSEQKGIARPEEFAHAAYSLLGLVQTMNTAIGNTFTASTAVGGTDDSEKGIAEALQTIPTVEARHMAAFTSRLAGQVQPKSSQAKSRQ